MSVLQVHGTSDETIKYDGGSIASVDYPSAPQTVQSWVAYNGCDTTPTFTADALDLDGGLDRAESDVAVDPVWWTRVDVIQAAWVAVS